MINNDNFFTYIYSATQQDEVSQIRKKYLPEDTTSKEGMLRQLRRLDKQVTSKATVISLVLGIAGVLILGTGMSLIMELGGSWFVIGIIIGVFGLALLSLAAPMYFHVLKKERRKAAPTIIKLADEIEAQS